MLDSRAANYGRTDRIFKISKLLAFGTVETRSIDELIDRHCEDMVLAIGYEIRVSNDDASESFLKMLKKEHAEQTSPIISYAERI